MRELDVLLTRYLDRQFERAGNAEKAAFHTLLSLSDPELVAYLLRGVSPDDAHMKDVVQHILLPPDP